MRKESVRRIEKEIAEKLEALGIPLKGKEHKIDVWCDDDGATIIINAFNVMDTFTLKTDKEGRPRLYQVILLIFKALDIGIDYGHTACIRREPARHIYLPHCFLEQGYGQVKCSVAEAKPCSKRDLDTGQTSQQI